MSGAKTKPRELRARRRPTRHSCWDRLILAPLWVAYDANLGTLLRTCDAVGACLAVPRTKHYQDALEVGDTLRGRRPCIHWVSPTREGWIDAQRTAGKRIVAVELAEGATPLPRPPGGARVDAARLLRESQRHGPAPTRPRPPAGPPRPKTPPRHRR